MGSSWNTTPKKWHLHGSGSTTNEGTAGSASSWHSSQDQLIVLFTVATMAIMVGAISAKRLRNQHILESCLHPDLNEDDDLDDFHVIGSVSRSGGNGGNNGSRFRGVRYDKKYDLDTAEATTRSVVSGFSAITGSGGGGMGKLKSGDFGALLGGGGSGGYYGTNGMNGDSGTNGGRLHWRGGDMEKFDV